MQRWIYINVGGSYIFDLLLSKANNEYLVGVLLRRHSVDGGR